MRIPEDWKSLPIDVVFDEPTVCRVLREHCCVGIEEGVWRLGHAKANRSGLTGVCGVQLGPAVGPCRREQVVPRLVVDRRHVAGQLIAEITHVLDVGTPVGESRLWRRPLLVREVGPVNQRCDECGIDQWVSRDVPLRAFRPSALAVDAALLPDVQPPAVGRPAFLAGQPTTVPAQRAVDADVAGLVQISIHAVEGNENE